MTDNAADAAARDQAMAAPAGGDAGTTAEAGGGSGAAPPATGGSTLHDAPAAQDDAGAHDEGDGGREAPQVDATAAAVKLAEEHGLDLSELEGSGSGGRITQADVQRVVSNPPEEGDHAHNEAEARAALEAMREEEQEAPQARPKRVVVRDGAGLRSYETEDGEVYFRDVARDVAPEKYQELGRYKVPGTNLRLLVEEGR